MLEQKVEKKEIYNEGNGGVAIAWVGVIIARIGQYFDYWLLCLIIGTVITILGCVLWTKRNNRHWAFSLWGILAPIGFLGISLLKEKPRIGNGRLIVDNKGHRVS